METSQLRGIIERARTCAVGRDYDGVLTAMGEASAELDKADAETAAAAAVGSEPEPGTDTGATGQPEGSAEPQGDGGPGAE